MPPLYGNYGQPMQQGYGYPYQSQFAQTLAQPRFDPYQNGMPNVQGQPMQQMPQQMQQSGPAIAAIPVSSIDEAKAFIITPDNLNTKYLFTDTDTGKIYQKNYDFATGKPAFRVFTEEKPEQPVPVPVANNTEPSPAPQNEPAPVFLTADDVQPLQCQITGLQDEIQRLKEELKNVRSIPVDSAVGNVKDSAKPDGNATGAGVPTEPVNGSTKKSK